MNGGTAGRVLRRRLIAGLVVIAPVTVTALVLWWIFQWLDGLLGPFISAAIGRPVPGLGLLALFVLLFVVGWAAERAVGARLLRLGNATLERIPFARRVYNASNRIVRTIFTGERGAFGQVVLVEYPSAGRWSIGFLTAAAPPLMREGAGDDAVAVFVPTTPNPTSGWIVVISRARTVPLPMTAEQALTYILSAGAVWPDAVRHARPLSPE